MISFAPRMRNKKLRLLCFLSSPCSRQARGSYETQGPFLFAAATAENCSGDFVTGFGTGEVITSRQRDSFGHGTAFLACLPRPLLFIGGLGVVCSGRNLFGPVFKLRRY
jgi:hypothetical protein